MKTLRRENRIPRGTRAKVARILKDLRDDPPPDALLDPTGFRIFAVHVSRKASKRRRKRNHNRQPKIPSEYVALAAKYRGMESN